LGKRVQQHRQPLDWGQGGKEGQTTVIRGGGKEGKIEEEAGGKRRVPFT